MIVKLAAVIAVCSGKKTQAEKVLTEIYQKLPKSELYSGLSRVYNPLNEDGETQPSEEKLPQLNVNDSIEAAKVALTELINIVATQDTANTQAKADVVVDEKVVLKNVPVTHLLFLEKQLNDIQTFVSKLPTLDAAERWTFDSNVNYFATPVTQTNRNIKKYKNHVKAEATDKHPAQVEVYTEDQKVGTWNTVKFSSCIEASKKAKFALNVKKLIESVKVAREMANSIEVNKVNYADDLLEFIFT